MKIRKNNYLLILNIIHTLMSCGIWVITLSGSLFDGDSMIIGIAIDLITLLAVIGMWLLYALPSPKAAVILFRIKSILKLILIICVSFVVMIILLAALDCAHSLSGNEGGAPLPEKLKIIVPFLSLIVLSIFYLVIYQILLSYINKRVINKPMMIIAFIFNVILCLCGIVFTISSLLQLFGNGPIINVDLINNFRGISQYIFIVVLFLYISYKGFTSFLLMKNIAKK